MEGLTVNGNTWTAVTSGGGQYGTSHPPDVSESDYLLVKFKGPLSGPQHDELKRVHVDIIQYMGNDVYLCGFKPKKAEDLQAVHDLGDFVQEAKIYHPNLVAHPSLKEGDPNDKVDVQICLHDNIPSTRIEEVKAKIATIIGASAQSVEITDDGITKIEIQRDKLLPLATMDEVYTINQYQESELFNNVACEIMQIRGPTVATAIPFNGSKQNIFVADSGFDTGETTPGKYHAAFGDRVKEIFPLGRGKTLASPQAGDDPTGHGTHVCGSVLGKLQHKNNMVIEGPASGAKLYVQSIFSGWQKRIVENKTVYRALLGGLEDFPPGPKLFGPAIKKEAFIHTNSWGYRGRYEAQVSGSIDDFAWRHPSMVILFAAGNDGDLGTQASARNCIAVGASESTRHNANKDSVIFWSSCGPTSGGQIKPDLVAPGTAILSARSKAIDTQKAGPHDDPTDPRFQFMQGTSMATPLVAGCCAVLREALSAAPHNNNSPASSLIKALLINGADPLVDRPNSTVGFGRVNMANSLQHVVLQPNPPLAGFEYRDGDKALRLNHAPTDKLQEFTFTIPAVAAGRTLAVTLVWTDPWGLELQHELELSVTGAGQTHSWDGPKNNVQRVIWKNVAAGPYQVLIKAIRLHPQPLQEEAATQKVAAFQTFAYAWRVY